MGNRAYVIFTSEHGHSPAVYLHWNGGPESVYPALDTLAGFGARGGDHGYACARFIQMMGNFFGGTLSLGVEDAGPEPLWPTVFNPGDNGLYVIRWTGLTNYGVKRYEMDRMLTPDRVDAEQSEARKHSYSTGGTLLEQLHDTNPRFLLDSHKD